MLSQKLLVNVTSLFWNNKNCHGLCLPETYSLTLFQRRCCPGSRPLLLLVQRLLFLAARCLAAKPGAFQGILLHAVRAQHNSQV